jgi:hypothetical protein
MCKHHLRVLSGNAVLAGTRGELGARTDRYCELGFEPTERLMNVATLPSQTLLVPAPHARPCGVLDLNGYFAPLRMMVDRMVEEGFLHERHRASLIFG